MATDKADEQFHRAKDEAMTRAFGPGGDVLHSIIPFHAGGALDLYLYPSAHAPGTVILTKELIGRTKRERPMKGPAGWFELAACLPPGVPPSVDSPAMALANRLLNGIAQFSFDARLGPEETVELPPEEDSEETPAQDVALDAAMVVGNLFALNGENLPLLMDRLETFVPFVVGAEEFLALVCIPLHRSELEFAHDHNVGALREELRAAGVYPYCIPNRPAVA